MLVIKDSDRPDIYAVMGNSFTTSGEVIAFVNRIPVCASVRRETAANPTNAVNTLVESSLVANELQIVLEWLLKEKSNREDIQKLILQLSSRPGWKHNSSAARTDSADAKTTEKETPKEAWIGCDTILRLGKPKVRIAVGCFFFVFFVGFVGLLRPTVQEAREAARFAQCKANLKNLGIALHDYSDVHGTLPAGTIVGSAESVEDRLSWLVTLLPYLDQTALFQQTNLNKAWNSPDNGVVARTKIPNFLNPSLDNSKSVEGYEFADYAGVAGLGERGPDLKPNEKGAGIFADDFPRRLTDITDGQSATLMVGEISKDRGPWIQGGRSTIRPLTKAPYIEGPDGFGGGHARGCLFLMADGSVRVISDAVNPEVLEAGATIQGGEVSSISDF